MKRMLKAAILGLSVAALMCVSALAAEAAETGGFYNVGTTDGVTIVVQTESQGTVGAQSGVNISGVDNVTAFYPDSARLAVTYDGAVKAGDQFLVMLVKGNALPDADSAIYYINQVGCTAGAAAAAGNVSFDVYPILPEETEKTMTLYITSNQTGFSTKSVALGYAAAPEAEPDVDLGDVNADGKINSSDALMILQKAVDKITLTAEQELAADVNKDGKINSSDALQVLQYAVGKIQAFG